MHVLVINVGSTSLKYDLYDGETRRAHGNLERKGDTDVGPAVTEIATRVANVDAVGHRVVHGGERLVEPTRIDASVEDAIRACAEFAPLHNPHNLEGIRAARAAFPSVPHVAVFDTAFHATMPARSYLYGLPYALYVERRVRRYGFHGPSHEWMTIRAREILGFDGKLVTCHLGGGCSVAAIDRGVSIDTSMGLTPLEGLIMGTRCGDIDPALPGLLARWGYDVDRVLSHESGLAGISGMPGDFRAIEAAAAAGDERAALAIDMFVQRVQRYIGGYAAELGGVDAIVFAGGIGENAAGVRERICANLGFLRSRVLVVPTEEERLIAREVVRCLAPA